MKKKMKRGGALLLCVVLLLTMIPTTVSAANVTISADTTWESMTNDDRITINSNAGGGGGVPITITVKGKVTITNMIRVATSVTFVGETEDAELNFPSSNTANYGINSYGSGAPTITLQNIKVTSEKSFSSGLVYINANAGSVIVGPDVTIDAGSPTNIAINMGESSDPSSSSISSSATIIGTVVTPAPVTPAITTQPVGGVYSVDDDTALLNITVEEPDKGELSYQWYSNTTNSPTGGAPISGATSASYLPPTDTPGIMYYYCVVTNTLGGQTAEATSAVAKVTVTAGSAQTRLDAPALSSTASAVTSNYVTLAAPDTSAQDASATVEYRMSSNGGGNYGDWQSGAQFTGLAAATAYHFQARYAAGDTTNYSDSEPSAAVSITTSSAAVNISGYITASQTWNEGDVVSDSVMIFGSSDESNPLVITVNGTVLVNRPINILMGSVAFRGGGMLQRNAYQYGMFELLGGNLTLENITLDGGNLSNSSRWLAKVNPNCMLTMKDGAVLKNNINNTSSSFMNAYTVNLLGGSFIMEGGEIIGNKNAYGGAVGLCSPNATSNDATFTMTGGAISGNTDIAGAVLKAIHANVDTTINLNPKAAISISGAFVKSTANSKIVITPDPEYNYNIDSVTADGIPQTAGGGGIYTITGFSTGLTVAVSAGTGEPPAEPDVEAPRFSPDPEAGPVEGGTEVTITCGTEGAEIYYTLDGSTPDAATGALYDGPITITDTVTIKAVGVKGDSRSEVTAAGYIVKPYTISDEEDLRVFARAVNAGGSYAGETVALENDITLTGEWTPIGTETSPFMGTFDGGGHTVSGLCVNNGIGGGVYLGLFGCIYGATLKDVTVEGAITSAELGSEIYAGGLVGYVKPYASAVISGCVNKADVTIGRGSAGGLAGYTYNMTLSDCLNYGAIRATYMAGGRSSSIYTGYTGYLGGLAGKADVTAIERCGNYGDILGEGETFEQLDSTAPDGSGVVLADIATGYQGGLTGQSGGGYYSSSGSIANSFNKGAVTGWGAYMGGLSGEIAFNTSISNCYNTGAVTQEPDNYNRMAKPCYTGGLVGRTYLLDAEASLTNCYSIGALSSTALSSSYKGLNLGVMSPLFFDAYDGTTGVPVAVNNCYGADTARDNISLLLAAVDAGSLPVYQADVNNINGGMPLLSWESPEKSTEEHAVTFQVTPSDAAVEVFTDPARTGDSKVEPAGDNAWSLPMGIYYYTVSAPGYNSVEGSFSVTYVDVTVKADLKAGAEITFTVTPADADFVVTTTGGEVQTPVSSGGGVYVYQLNAGALYTYTATADGYNGATREYKAVGGGSVTVVLTPSGQNPNNPTITGGQTISAGGVYNLGRVSGATQGVITINTTEPVTLIGTGISTSDAYENLYIKCTAAGVNLTLQDLYISNTAGAANMIDFTGANNELYFSGVNILDMNTGATGYAMIHAGRTAELTVGGVAPDDTLYFYKREQGAGIGGNQNEYNGKITVTGGNLFMKNSKQGALIGSGANAKAAVGSPGDIVIEGGVLNLIPISRGAAIGGSAGNEGGATGTNVYIHPGANVNINVDYSGSAIGGGGFAEGNDSDGGILHYSGGSIRTFIDYNAVNLWAGVTGAGVNDIAITADKRNSDGANVYLLTFDTTRLSDQSGSYTVEEGGAVLYSGGLHTWRYINEDLYKTDQIEVNYTIDNWAPLNDPNLYLYLTGEDHTLIVNGEEFDIRWDSETSSFSFGDAPATPAAPAITTQPSGATYTVGDPAAALTVTASTTDGGELSYQWYSSADNTATTPSDDTAVGTGVNTYTPPTAEAGATYYYCVVTNTLDGRTATATSDVVAVVVNAEGPGELAPPTLTPDTTNNTVGQAAEITFPTDAAWEAAISGITVNGTALTGAQYTVSAGNINIAAGAFSAPGDHIIIVTAAGYEDAVVIQTMAPVGPGPQVPVTLNLSTTAAQAGEEVTASGAAPANTWISLKVLDDGQNIIVFDAVKSDSQGSYSISFIIPAAGGEALTVITGYGANVAAAALSLKLNPPALQADTDNNIVGQSIDITFSADAQWQAAVSGVTVNGAPLTIGQYTVSAGSINIAAEVFGNVGDYSIVVTADGYKDAQVTQAIAAKAPPALTADSSDNVAGQAIDLTFTENADWQAAVSGITVGGTPLTPDQYTVSAGNINIVAGAFSAAGSYQVIVSADNYADAAVAQEILGSAPELTADITNNSPGQAIEITFTDNEAWRGAITDITVDGDSIAGKYTVAAGVITLDNTVFTGTGNFSIAVKATGYADATVTQTILNPYYLITPEADQIYVISETQDGIKIMTVNAGVTGMKYFNVGVTPVRIHNGKETLVFVHLRGGQQDSLNTSIGDFDLIDGAGTGFNVQAGDVIKVYMVDQLTNAIDFNPTIFQ